MAEEKDSQVKVDYEAEVKRLTEHNETLKNQNKKLVAAFNKLLDEYNELHVQWLLNSSDN